MTRGGQGAGRGPVSRRDGGPDGRRPHPPLAAPARAGLGRALLAAAGINLAASLAMALVLAGATPAGGDPAARLAYVAAHRPAVTAGWALWIGATLGLLLSLWALARLAAPRRRPACHWALLAAAAGAAVDIAADVLHMTVVPVLAQQYAAARSPAEAAAALDAFRVWDAAAVALTGGAANGLYALAGAVITHALARSPWIPRPLVAWGALVWTAAALATAALAWLPALLPPAVGITMALYVSWTAACGWWLLGGARRGP